MKKVFYLIFHLRLKELLTEPTCEAAIQLFRSLIVGGLSFCMDTAVLWLLEHMGMHYLLAAVFGFIAGVTVNYLLSSFFVFSALTPTLCRTAEMLIFLLISLVGLGLTELLMWLFTDRLGVFLLLSKVISTVIVYVWNFLARRLILYKK